MIRLSCLELQNLVGLEGLTEYESSSHNKNNSFDTVLTDNIESPLYYRRT